MPDNLGRAGVVLICCLASGPAAQAADGTVSRIGIFNITVSGLQESVEGTALDAVATTVAGLAGYEAISRSDLQTMLGFERQQALTGCDDVTCLAEMGMAAGVDRLIGGSLSSIDGTLVVSLQLINAKYATIENRVTLEWSGGTGEMTNLLGAAAELLVLPHQQRAPGGLKLSGVPADGIVAVDGESHGAGVTKIDALPVGVHQLSVSAPDHEPLHTQVVVRSGKTSTVPVMLTPKQEAPFYAKWWFWSVTGAAVVGGGAAAAYALTRGGDTGTVRIQSTAPSLR